MLRNSKNAKLLAASFFLLLFISLTACSFTFTAQHSSNLVVSYIDVGQGLSVLVQFPNGTAMLYDAGPNKSAETIVNYLKNHSVSKIDVLILSHPDSDHIGAADEVIESFIIGSFYMPKVPHSTQSYLDVLSAAKAKKLTIKTAQEGVTISLDPEVKVTMWGPVKEYDLDDTNNWSAVVSITYGSTSFLLTGDAGQEAENDMINTGVVEPQTALQVGHHGSKYSTSTEFLNAVTPTYAVISVGENSYGHPSEETLSRLQSYNVHVFRTDKQGTVVATSDGKTITWNVEPIGWEDSLQASPTTSQTDSASTATPKQEALPKVVIINKDLKEETVVIKNNDAVDIDMSGWSLVSVKGNQVFPFPEGFRLGKGKTVTITSGFKAYEDSPSVLKWTSSTIWNNDGDPAELLDDKGRLVSSLP